MGGYWGWFNGDRVYPWGTILEDNARAAVTVLRARVAEARRGRLPRRTREAQRPGVADPDGLITVLHDPGIPADSARRVLATAARELALYPQGDGPGMPVIVALYGDSSRHPDLKRHWWRRQAYVRDVGPAKACIVELNWMGRELARWKGGWPLRGWPLNGCALFARLGRRGGAADRPLRIGPLLLENPYGPSLTDQLLQARRQAPSARTVGVAAVVESHPVRQRWIQRAPPFQWRASACLQGSDRSCLLAANLLGWRGSRWVWRWNNPFRGTSLLASLLAWEIRDGSPPCGAPTCPPRKRSSTRTEAGRRVVREVARRQWTRSRTAHTSQRVS